MIRIYLRRIVSIVALALVALAISQPVSATDIEVDTLDPLAGAVAGAVESTSTELSHTVETTAEPVVEDTKTTVGSVTDEVSVPDAATVASDVDAPDPATAAPGALSSGPATDETAGPARRGQRSRSGSAGSKQLAQDSDGDDRKELLAAGNDVMTTLTLGTVQRKATPKKPSGAPLALTGTSILMGLIAGLVLMAVGVGTETAARRSGTAVA